MDEVRRGRIDCIVVKDLSRFGRNYKETGNYLERIFPFLGVRFIAVNDNFDTLTAERTQDGYIVPLKNLINEVYSKDISKKSASALHVKQQNGEFHRAWHRMDTAKTPTISTTLLLTRKQLRRTEIFRLRYEVSRGADRQALNDAVFFPPRHISTKQARSRQRKQGVLWHTQIIKSILAHPVT